VTEKQNTMYYHIKKIHEKDLPFVCKRCDDCPRFLQRTSYLHHLATIHADDPHPQESGVETTDPSLLMGPTSKEGNELTVEKPVERNPYAGVSYSCPCCDHKTHTKANILIHFSRSHCKDWIPNYEKGTACASCSKVFASSSAYLYHATGCYKSRASEDQLNMLSRIR
jgi:hypothetical protein